MNSIRFYRDRSGNQPVLDYMRELANTNGKEARMKLRKINDYVQMLAKYGLSIGEPYIKRIEDDIWELRPLNDRIFFVAWTGNEFVLLHVFRKKSQATPKQEKEQAKRELKDLKERGFEE